MGMENVVSRDFNDALIEMKDSAIMLYMAGEYLCENFFLKKTGAMIKENLDLLREHVKRLEKKLIGKPLEEFNLDEYFEPVSDIAQFLQSPDDDIRNKCVKGELGRELHRRVISLIGKIGELNERVEGKVVSYTAADSVKVAFGRVRFISDSVIFSSKWVFRLSALFIIGVLVTLFFLGFTMEKITDLQKNIDQTRGGIQALQDKLIPINERIWPVLEEIETLRKDDLTRQEDIRLLELNLKKFRLFKNREKILIEVDIHEKRMQEDLDKLEKMKAKSLIRRLVRL